METAKKKITVRFVVEQDFEIEVKDSDLGMGSSWSVGDVMVSSGYDTHNLLTHENVFDNPVGELRPVQGEHWFDVNLYNLGLHSEYIQPWLFEGEEDKDPYEEEEGYLEDYDYDEALPVELKDAS